MTDGMSVMAVMLIAAFASDSVVRAAMFLLAFNPGWARAFAAPDRVSDPNLRASAERRQKLVYLLGAGVFAVVLLVGYKQLRLLQAFDVGAPPVIDAVVTALVLVGGADRVGQILNLSESPAPEAATQSLEITGTLVLDERGGQALRPEREAPPPEATA